MPASFNPGVNARRQRQEQAIKEMEAVEADNDDDDTANKDNGDNEEIRNVVNATEKFHFKDSTRHDYRCRIKNMIESWKPSHSPITCRRGCQGGESEANQTSVPSISGFTIVR